MRLEKRRSGLSVLGKITGSVLVLAVAITGGGIIFGWWGGPQPEHGTVLAKQTESINTQSVAKTQDEPLSVSIQSLTTPAPQESITNMTVKTAPTADCTIKAVYAGVASTDSGLVAKTADGTGDVSWTWMIEESAPLGTWPVTVTCTHDGQSATAHGSIVVSEPPAH